MNVFFVKSSVIVVITSFLFGCSMSTSDVKSASGARLHVVTTIAPLYSMTVNIAGDVADVANLVPIGASEHTYQARPSDALLLSKADLVIKNGVQLELFLDPLLSASQNTQRKILDTSSGIRLLQSGDAHEGESVGGFDPHVWLSIPNALIQIQTITEALSQMDPKNAAKYKSNAEAYIKHLTSVDLQIREAIRKSTKKPYILFHDGFQYFEKSYGVHSEAVVEEFPGKEPSAGYMKELYDIIIQKNVRIAFTEPQFSPKIIQQLKERFSLITKELDTIGSELSPLGYEKLLRANSDAFLAAFSES